MSIETNGPDLTVTHSHIIGIYSTKRTCPIHGPQGDESLTIRLTPKVEYYCLACFAAWVRANLQPLTDVSDGVK